MSRGRKKSGKAPRRRLPLLAALGGAVALFLYSALGVWFVHHPRRWLDRYERSCSLVAGALEAVGNPVGDLTDNFGWTGHDTVYEYDEPAPEGSVSFAGQPVRRAPPAPADLVVIPRGEFKIGWSPSLRHPVWVQYHVPRTALYPTGMDRPSFRKDGQLPRSAKPADFTHSGYERGHMAPNYAISTRFGPEAQKRTFLMSNIAPQSPALNRGPWRNLEHRIADFWTERYGEIWVTVGCFTPVGTETERINHTDIDVPQYFYMVVIAQESLDIRALAVLLPQNVSYNAYPARYLVTIDELEELTGLDFLPDLPSFIQSPLQAELPTRLWPVSPSRALDTFLLNFAKPY